MSAAPQTAPCAWAYMVRCPDGSLYSGWTNDLARRLRAHNSGKGARYTRMRGQGAGGIALAYAEPCTDKSAALRREAALKRLPKAEKEALAAAWAAASKPRLRMAAPADAAAVAAVYNWYVHNSTACFQQAPVSTAAFRKSIGQTLQNAPFLLAEAADGTLLGYACAHPWGEKDGFAWDAETTIYCAPHSVGQGVGRALYRALLALLKAQGYRNVYARITHPNPGSAAFHKRFGFVRYALEPNTAYKNGRWLDLAYWRLTLQAPVPDPPPVQKQLPAALVRAILEGAEAP